MLGYYELPEDDQPPETLWGNDDALVELFEGVKFRRENPDNSERVPEASEMTENEYVQQLGL